MEGDSLSSGSSELSEDSTQFSSSEVSLRVKKGPGLLAAANRLGSDQERWSLIDLYGEIADQMSVRVIERSSHHVVVIIARM